MSDMLSQTPMIDSLKKVLPGQSDTARAKTLYLLAREYRNSSPDTSVYYGKQALELSEKSHFDKGMIEAWLWLGTAVTNQGKYTEAIAYFTNALQKQPEKKVAARIYTNMGNAYYYEANYPAALKSYFAALKIKEEMGDKRGIANSYVGIGNVYSDQGNYPEALKNHLVSLKLRLEIGNKDEIATSYSNIGIVNWYQHNYTEALKNYEQALALKKETGDKPGLAMVSNNIALVYSSLGKYEESLKYNYAALKIREEIGDLHGLASAEANLGEVYKILKRYQEGEAHCKRALEVAEKIGALNTSKVINLTLSDIYTETGKYAEALQCYKKYVSLKDSLFNEENTKKTVQTQMQYEFEKREAEAKSEQEKKDAIAKAESNKQKIILRSIIGLLIVVLAFAIFAYRSYLQKRKANEAIKRQKELIEEKQKEILDSIHYARRIQTALIPSERSIQKNLKPLTL